MKRVASAVVGLAFSLAMNTATAQLHEHGRADMGIVVEGNALVAAFSSPLFNLVGFEHTPSTSDERQAMREMRGTLNNASEWLIPNSEAACLIEAVEHKTVYSEREGEPQDATLEVRVELACSHPENLRSIDVRIFSLFENIEQINVLLKTTSQQVETILNAQSHKIAWSAI